MPRTDRCDNCLRPPKIAFGVAQEGITYYDPDRQEVDGLVFVACGATCKRELLLLEAAKVVRSGGERRYVRPKRVPSSFAVWDEDLDEVLGTS